MGWRKFFWLHRLMWRCGKLIGLWMIAALAHAVPVSQAPGVSLHVIEGLDAQTSVEQVAGLPLNRFGAHQANRNYQITAQSPLWLRLSVSHATSPTLQLEFPSVLVDRYEVYQRDDSGIWQMQAAGDRVAHSTWPLVSLRPRFDLQPSAQGERFAYVRIVHQLPTSLQPQIVEPHEAVQRDGLQLLWTGLLVGVVFTLVMACAQMSWAYRDITYTWYALYLVFTMMAALAYSGIAQSWLWPQATKFASDAVVYGVMGAFAFNLQFSRAMFGSLQGRGYHALAHVLFACCIGYAVLTIFVEQYARFIWIFNATCAAIFVFILYSALNALRKGVRFALYWLIVYTPYLLIIHLVLLNSIGIVSAPWLPSATPILAAVLEAVAMMLCINAHSRLRHAQAVQQQVAAWHDPLTGFLNASSFRQKAQEIWQAAPGLHRPVAVAFITVEPVTTSEEVSIDHEALMARSVRLVRSIAREFDTVGRLSRHRLALVMADVPEGEMLNGRLSRLVALGLMRDNHPSLNAEIRFRISVGLRHHFAGSYAELESALLALAQTQSKQVKPIAYLTAKTEHQYPQPDPS
jgi:GGDEF domain-containing protein